MLKNSKLYGLILGIILFVILITGITYAYLTWESSSMNFPIKSDCFVIDYFKGKNITNNKLHYINEEDFFDGNNIKIVDGMELTTIGLGINQSCNVSGVATIKLDVSTLSGAFITGNSAGALKYKIVEYSSDMYPNVTTDILKDTTFTVIQSGSIMSQGMIDLYSTDISNSRNDYIIIFYLDEVLIQNDAVGALFYGTISAEVVQKG